MKKIKLSTQQAVLYCFLAIVFVGEVIYMFFSPEITVFHAFSMMLLCFGDVVISFIKNKSYKWIDFAFFGIYLVLTIINAIIFWRVIV